MDTRLYGLIGRDIAYSFSGRYFTERFARDGMNGFQYELFDLPALSDFPALLKTHPELRGLNVTIPYKEEIIPYLDKLSVKAAQIGAVNTIRFTKKGKLKGYNTDCFGFEKSLQPLLQPHHQKALIMGTGGASKAIAYVLERLGIAFAFASRHPSGSALSYDLINETTFDNYQIFINCTPLGTFPNIDQCPQLPYQFFSHRHIAYDLIYNPEETEFLKRARLQGATTKNGHEMLVLQAEKSWKIWNK